MKNTEFLQLVAFIISTMAAFALGGMVGKVEGEQVMAQCLLGIAPCSPRQHDAISKALDSEGL